jgi:hypothetical protein
MGQQFVKVTNITWKNDPSGRGFDCYLNNHLIPPKDFVTIKFNELPKNWADLQKMLKFEMFTVEESERDTPASPQQMFTADDLKLMLQEALKGMTVPAGTPPAQPQVVNTPHKIAPVKLTPPPMFIPDQVASVDSADINIQSQTAKGESLSSLKDKLKAKRP